MKYHFSDPTKTTFKAIRFNNQIFARGRGLFIHIMKYFPQIAEQSIKHSRSKVEWTPENFSKATHGMKTHFKGIAFDYVDIDKEHKTAIQNLSKTGEGWWPERSKLTRPPLENESEFFHFLLNYEDPPKYVRRLGRGMNIPNEKRLEYQTGVDFTPKGFSDMQKAYRKKASSKRAALVHLPRSVAGYYFLPRLSKEFQGTLEVQPALWVQWSIRKRTNREEFLENVD